MPRPFYQNPHLDGTTFYLAGNSTGVLLIHGFTATTIEVRPLGEFFHSKGFSVLAPLLPGHGTRPDDMFEIKWEEWVESAEIAFNQLNENCSKIIIAGESMGGLLCLHLASKYQEIAGILLYAPAIKIPGIWKACLIAPFIKIRPKSYLKSEDETFEDGQEILPWQGYNVLPVPGVCQLSKLQKYTVKKLSAVQQPIIIFQGEADTTVDPGGAKMIYENVASVKKKLIYLQNSGHCIVLDRDLSDVKEISADFIKECVP
jgi:carboxylesterase